MVRESSDAQHLYLSHPERERTELYHHVLVELTQVLIHIKPKRCVRPCLIGIQFHTLKCLPYYTIQGIFRYIIEDPNQENNKCTNILIKFALKRNN